jgi:hypothetical protein
MRDHLTVSQADGEGAAPPAEHVTIPKAELDQLRGLAGADEAGTRAPAAPEPPQCAGPDPGEAARGQEAWLARELAARDRRLSELERACKEAVRDRELATALAGKPLVAGAAAQLIKLWRDDFDAYEDGGQFKVAAKDGRPVAQVVGEWLGAPEFAHFCLPSSKGGTGARGVERPAAAAPPAAPRNLGEAVVMRWREDPLARPNNLLKPIGLRRTR